MYYIMSNNEIYINTRAPFILGGSSIIVPIVKSKYLLKIIDITADITYEMNIYNQIIKIKGIDRENIIVMKIIPISHVINYAEFMHIHDPSHKRFLHKTAILMENLNGCITDIICNNMSVNIISHLKQCKPLFKYETVKHSIIKLIHLIKTMNENNYYHNDIKPENIALTKNGRLILIDFGISFKKNDVSLKESLGFFSGYVVYNFSIFTLRGNCIKHKSLDNFIVKYMTALISDAHFDLFYKHLFGTKEYAKYLESIYQASKLYHKDNMTPELIRKAGSNIDSFGLGIVLMQIYCLTKINKNIHNSYHDDNMKFIIKLLLCQDVMVQISPIDAYNMIM